MVRRSVVVRARSGVAMMGVRVGSGVAGVVGSSLGVVWKLLPQRVAWLVVVSIPAGRG